MKVIVIDLEMNQPSGNICEIGALCIDLRSCRVTGKFNSLVRLPEGELLNPEITDLTGITGEMLTSAPGNYPDMLVKFWAWVGASGARMLASWGRDHDMLIGDSRDRGIDYPTNVRKLDVKSMYNIIKSAYPNRKVKGGLQATLTTMGMEFHGRPHRAYDDAHNTARLLLRCREIAYQMNYISNMTVRDIEL